MKLRCSTGRAPAESRSSSAGLAEARLNLVGQSMPTVREAAFRTFAHFGVDRLFGNPGSTELPMLKALPDGFRYVLGLNEAVVVAMATREPLGHVS